MSGRLVVLEGTDGSGKSTQMGMLVQALTQRGCDFRQLRFPRYGKPSCALVEQYLAGAYGTHPGDVNAYAASTFYAVDRYASFREDWGADYLSGRLLVSDRYTTSNAVHQTPKLPPEERVAFLRWLYDLEYDKMGLPRPDLVLYLDMPIWATEQMMARRAAQTGVAEDIHERDTDYLRLCREVGLQAASLLGWQVVPCAHEGRVRSAEEIHQAVLQAVLEEEAHCK